MHRALLAGLMVLLLGVSTLPAPALDSVLESQSSVAWAPADDATEAAGYVSLFEYAIGNGSALHSTGLTYDVNETANTTFTFDRVGYHLELQRPNESRVWVWVSFPTLTTEPALLGVPVFGTGIEWQQMITDMVVESNHPNLSALGSIDTGVIEFWPSNYAPANAIAVPGANATLYDFGDSPGSGAGYGSMQLHDHGSGETLFSWSGWGYNPSADDLGIGSRPTPVTNPDWTFARNTDEYTLRTLRVMVHPGPWPANLGMDLDSPQPHQVVQRDGYGVGLVEVSGTSGPPIDWFEGRHAPVGTTNWSEWERLGDALGQAFHAIWELPEGWHRLELRTHHNGSESVTFEVSPVGVGEVFIVAGQSNSANHGETALVPTDPRVSTWGPSGWREGHDPQPAATGTRGSPWPPLGDRLTARYDVPVGFLSVGYGGTKVDRWVPEAADLFPRLTDALDETRPGGVRGILWHQGESNAGGTTSEDYADMLAAVVLGTRAYAGESIPWFVARVGFTPSADPNLSAQVVAGQDAVIEADPLTFAGPYTDDLNGTAWRYDTIHFNVAGLEEHARRWEVRIVAGMATLWVIDSDDDGVLDDIDACLETPLGDAVFANGCSDGQLDSDWDGVINMYDRCQGHWDRIDVDGDGIVDGCDDLIDSDRDGVADALDRCRGHDDAVDVDGDGLVDGCDPLLDRDGDHVSDAEDVCDGHDDSIDEDDDAIPDGCDHLIDSDGDEVGDLVDACPGFHDALDADADGIPDGCDAFLDTDGDGVRDAEDQCEGHDDALDEDGDGIPTGCDEEEEAALDVAAADPAFQSTPAGLATIAGLAATLTLIIGLIAGLRSGRRAPKAEFEHLGEAHFDDDDAGWQPDPAGWGGPGQAGQQAAQVQGYPAQQQHAGGWQPDPQAWYGAQQTWQGADDSAYLQHHGQPGHGGHPQQGYDPYAAAPNQQQGWPPQR